MSEIWKNKEFRKTSQNILPVNKKNLTAGRYDIYPSFKVKENQFFTGFESLASRIKRNRLITIDGYYGNYFNDLRNIIDSILINSGLSTRWINTETFFKPPAAVSALTAPFLGGDDPIFGKRTTLVIEDFFIPGAVETMIPDHGTDINIIYGPGAALAGWEGLLIYIDIPKNEIQYRARAGTVTNLGVPYAADPREMYKNFYFVDWVVLNKHKRSILKKIDIFVDGQHPDMPVWTEGKVLRETLYLMSRNVFRARPWFEPGAWGGTWIKSNIDGLNKDVPNYAWSFELITPENGLLLESSSILLEVSFDCIMYLEAQAVLGDCYPRFGTDFPVRFDFLDTFDGGNLSLQCHPRPEYMKEKFGEGFTQEETYYILDTKENAKVYLGFCEGINPEEFRNELEANYKSGAPFLPDKYVMQLPVRKHDLLLIPPGTIHGSGKNNLVLEISSTPYIFTFKMYDWERPDLDGRPRPLNIERAFENLYFDRCGTYVMDKLISKPLLVKSGPDWKLFHLATHDAQLYDIQRYHFNTVIEIETGNKCLIMSLTEGESIEVVTSKGCHQMFSFAETFVIPAAARKVTIINLSRSEAILIKAFVK